MNRDELIAKIEETLELLKNAKGQRRRRDLRKHLFRMERDLAHYDNQMREAGYGD